jgi:hypothetical protein
MNTIVAGGYAPPTLAEDLPESALASTEKLEVD